jgi:hypothetical protein
MSCIGRFAACVSALIACTTVVAIPVEAQEPPPVAPPGGVSVTAGIDFLNGYYFRGLRQDDTGLILWPRVDFAVGLYSGAGVLKNITAHAGNWNSVHSGVAGSDGPSGDRWYESDIRAGVNVTLGGMLIDTTYVHYHSPNSMFTRVKELALRFGADDRVAIADLPLRLYAMAAFELDTGTGVGQADGGFDAGKYLELGVMPQFNIGALEIGAPVKFGFSLGGYYELAGTDHTFGYSSVSALGAIPIGRRTRAGEWRLRGSVEYQFLGETPRVLNNEDRHVVVGSIGLGWAR